MPSPKSLFELLRALFRSNEDLSVYLANDPYPNMDDLLAELPNTDVSRNVFLMAAIAQFQAHGLDSSILFARLTEKFPMRADLIDAARKAYFADAPAGPDKSAELKGDATLPTADDAQISAQEKIMGERPTFLDVAYLALGYQRAKSVALLRMKFPDGWYTGTAFLVRPDAMLTAHHNLWANGQPAEAIEVVFDYERSFEGPDPIQITVEADLGSFVGDQPSDWALFRLKQPLADRPLAPLASRAPVKDDRVAIIQHPGGMLKQVALHHNLVTFADATRLQYLTDTLPGSSGSPVFDGQWNVVGVHHAGGHLTQPGRKEAIYCNEGTTIGHVLAGLAALGVAL